MLVSKQTNGHLFHYLHLKRLNGNFRGHLFPYFILFLINKHKTGEIEDQMSVQPNHDRLCTKIEE